MLRCIILTIALCLAALGAKAQEMRQFFAETTTPLTEITARLAPMLPPSVVLTEGPGSTFLSYTGPSTPPGLAAFLESAFDTLDMQAIAPGHTASISLVMTGHSDRTDLSLMVRGRFATGRVSALPGGQIIMDGTDAGDCQGQLIVQHALPPDAVLRGYQEAFEADGYVFEEPDEQDLSFFIGSRPGCSVALYADGQEGGSTAVIRFLEE